MVDSTRSNEAPLDRKAEPNKRSRATLLVGMAGALVVFAWLLKGIVENWGELSFQLSKAPPWMIVAALCLQLLFMFSVSLCYYNSLRLAGADIRPMQGIAVYMASQLGKYVPGKVLYVAGQIGLASSLRIPVVQSVLGFSAYHVQLLAMGILMAGPLLGIVLSRTVLLIIGVAGAAGFLLLASGVWVGPFNAYQRRREKPELESFSSAYALRALLSAALGWSSYGAMAVVLALAISPEASTADLLRVGMAAIGGWVIGFLSFITPSGMGVREGAFVLLARSAVSEEAAMMIAILMRLLVTVLQAPTGIVALSYFVRTRKREKSVSSS